MTPLRSVLSGLRWLYLGLLAVTAFLLPVLLVVDIGVRNVAFAIFIFVIWGSLFVTAILYVRLRRLGDGSPLRLYRHMIAVKSTAALLLLAESIWLYLAGERWWLLSSLATLGLAGASLAWLAVYVGERRRAC